MAKVRLNKDVVLQAAIKIADKDGLNKVSLKKLAEQLKVRTPSLYNHIDGIEDLHDSMTLYGLVLLKNTLMDSAIGKSKDAAVKSMGEAYLNFAKKHPGLYEATQRADRWKNAEIIQASDDIVNIVAQVISAYDLEGEEVIHTIRTLRSLLHGFTLLINDEGFANPISIDTSFRFALDIFLTGILYSSKKK